MPEGDTIFRAARTLERALRGQRVTHFESVYPQLTRVDSDSPLAGRSVEAVSAAGKHLLMRFSGGLVLRTHMRMNGSWHLYRPGERWRRGRSRARVIVETEGWIAVGFDVPDATLHRAEALARSPVGELGPDLLGAEFDLAEALRRFRAGPDEEVGQALLDQRRVAGIGNEYKSELLFLLRLHPGRRVSAIDDATLTRLLRTARELLRRNVAEPAGPGRRTTRSSAPGQGLYVYGRGGRPCRRCGATIGWLRQGPQARSTYFCPRCQAT